MAFASTKTFDSIFGNKRVELHRFTELGTDTGGTITSAIQTIEGLFVSLEGGTAVAVRASFSGATITVTHAAGPTSGYVWVLGY